MGRLHTAALLAKVAAMSAVVTPVFLADARRPLRTAGRRTPVPQCPACNSLEAACSSLACSRVRRRTARMAPGRLAATVLGRLLTELLLLRATEPASLRRAARQTARPAFMLSRHTTARLRSQPRGASRTRTVQPASTPSQATGIPRRGRAQVGGSTGGGSGGSAVDPTVPGALRDVHRAFLTAAAWPTVPLVFCLFVSN